MRRRGFSLIETLVALMMVSLAAMLMLRSSGANAVAFRQARTKMLATRLGSELGTWVRRGGADLLNRPLADAIALDVSAFACYDGECDAAQGAGYLLSEWRERLQLAVPGVQISVCLDSVTNAPVFQWQCDSAGASLVLKLGWPPNALLRPGVVIELGPAP